MDKIDRAVITNRGRFYGCTEDGFFTPGTTFRHSESLDDENLIYLTKLYDRTFISAGLNNICILKEISRGGEIRLDYELISVRFENLRNHNAYPHLLYRKNSPPEVCLPNNYEIRRMDPDDHPPLQAFLDMCSEEDIDDALIILDDPDEEIRMIYRNGKPAAYAGYRLWEDGLGDTGILVHPDHRKKGLGTAAVAAVTAACIENGHIPFYRTSRENRGSLAIALRTGYEEAWETVVYEFDPT